MNPQETHSKVYRRKDVLEFSKVDFDILQTQFGPKLDLLKLHRLCSSLHGLDTF